MKFFLLVLLFLSPFSWSKKGPTVLRRDLLEKKLRGKILEREKELDMREIELKEKEDRLNLSEQSLEKRIKEFQEKQKKIIGCIEKNEKDRQKRIDHMVKVVSGMRAQSAADIMSVQDANVSLEILGHLSAKKVSKIFNLMNKEVSARLQKRFMDMTK